MFVDFKEILKGPVYRGRTRRVICTARQIGGGTLYGILVWYLSCFPILSHTGFFVLLLCEMIIQSLHV